MPVKSEKPTDTSTKNNMTATQLLVLPFIKARGQKLALVQQTSVADVWRNLVTGALPAAEASFASSLAELDAAFDRMGLIRDVDRFRALQAMIDQKVRFGDLFLADGSPRAKFPGKL